jgi:hypothetical protein
MRWKLTASLCQVMGRVAGRLGTTLKEVIPDCQGEKAEMI